MSRKKKGRAVNGILVLDKPSGVTSNYALQKVKKLFYAQKAGHTGSLDPLASGILPVCLGEATKVSHFLLDADKRYLATCQFGEVKSTGDSEGETLKTQPVPEYNEQTLNDLLNRFEGEQEQIPPMYSALKYQGRPLYELARQGKEIERKARRITIYQIRLINARTDSIDIAVHCSKGTYIRTLCEDIGDALGCGAHMTALRRISSGSFSLDQSITLEDLVGLHETIFAAEVKNRKPGGSEWQSLDRLLFPIDRAIKVYPRVEMDRPQNELIQQGQAIDVPLELLEQLETQEQAGEYYRLYFKNVLKALAVKDKTDRLTPKRLLFL